MWGSVVVLKPRLLAQRPYVVGLVCTADLLHTTYRSERRSGSTLVRQVQQMRTVAGYVEPPNELAGFGFPEEPTAVEICAQDQCARVRPSATDAYCHNHGRLLPIIKWATSARVAITIVT